MNRRHAVLGLLGLGIAPLIGSKVFGGNNAMSSKLDSGIEKISKSDAEWQKLLTPQQYDVLREEGTERPFTSALNQEKRKGDYVCAGCQLPLFTAEMKFDSGTGWPSFFEYKTGALEISTDFKMIYPRTEYHCARCGGHHGHVFKDGPKPTGLRYCNNGVALQFVPTET